MSKIRIVIADDHAIVREGTSSLLQKEADMEVVGEAGDGEEALRLLERLRPDVAILDIAMPKMTGIEVTRQIKNRVPSIAVLILTAYDNDEYVFKLLDAGAAGYLLKDAGSHELLGAVRSVFSGESALHPAIARKVIQRALRRDDKLEAQKTPEDLSEREMEILRLAARGLTNKEIADRLFLSARTVQGHLTSIFNKLSVGSRTEAIFKSAKKGWISFEDLQAERPGGEN